MVHDDYYGFSAGDFCALDLVEACDQLGITEEEFRETLARARQQLRIASGLATPSADRRLLGEFLAEVGDAPINGKAEWLVEVKGMSIAAAARWLGVRYQRVYNAVKGKKRRKRLR